MLAVSTFSEAYKTITAKTPGSKTKMQDSCEYYIHAMKTKKPELSLIRKETDRMYYAMIPDWETSAVSLTAPSSGC